MMRRLLVALALAMGAMISHPLAAQVGYPPQNSPYRDLRETQEVTLYMGYFVARDDPARVAPRSGSMVGALYQWRMGGPANLTFDLGRAESERQVLDPERLGTCPGPTPTAPPDTSVACKSLGMFRWPLYSADLGLGLNLTGARSWSNIVPQLRAGVGLVSDFHSKADVGEFAFGTRFALTWGAGIRWVPGGRFQLRADLLNRLYSVKYPTTYYQFADDGTTIFGPRQSRTAWLNNPALTIGVSYLFAR
jgi:hypothetical protein